MNEGERQLLAEELQPETVTTKKKPAEVLTRKIEKCDACNYTRRAAVHKDVNAPGYHEFMLPKSSSAKIEKIENKSARAVDMQTTLSKSLAQQLQATEVKCAYVNGGKTCLGAEGDGIHDKSLGYLGHHPFVSSSSARPAAERSSTNGPDQSSEIASENVSVAAGAGSSE
jgi:hypothetical protein